MDVSSDATVIMVTTTVSRDISKFELDPCGLDLFDAIIGLWIPGMLSVFGILGNAISLWVLSCDPVRSTALTSLKALAASDLLFLVGALGQQVIPLACDLTSSVDFLCFNKGYLQVYFWPILCVAQTASVWLTVLISTERYFAICSPLTLGRLSGRIRNVKVAIGAIISLSIAFNVPKFFEYRAEFDSRTCLSATCSFDDISTQMTSSCQVNVSRIHLLYNDLHHDVVYRYTYNIGLYGLVMYAVPLSTIAALNIHLVRVLHTARRNWAALNTNQKHELKATVLPLVIILVSSVCGTYSLFSFVLDASVNPEAASSPRWLQVCIAVGNVLVTFNSAVNFLLMLCFGNKFRQMLKDAVRCRSVSSSSARTKGSRFVSSTLV